MCDKRSFPGSNVLANAGYAGFIYQDVPRVTKNIKVNLDKYGGLAVCDKGSFPGSNVLAKAGSIEGTLLVHTYAGSSQACLA